MNFHNNMNCTLSSSFDRYVPCFAATSYVGTPIYRPERVAVCLSICVLRGKVNCDQFPKPGQIVTRRAFEWILIQVSVGLGHNSEVAPCTIQSQHLTGNADCQYRVYYSKCDRNSSKYYSSWHASSRIAISQLSWQSGMRKLEQRLFWCILSPRNDSLQWSRVHNILQTQDEWLSYHIEGYSTSFWW